MNRQRNETCEKILGNFLFAISGNLIIFPQTFCFSSQIIEKDFLGIQEKPQRKCFWISLINQFTAALLSKRLLLMKCTVM